MAGAFVRINLFMIPFIRFKAPFSIRRLEGKFREIDASHCTRSPKLKDSPMIRKGKLTVLYATGVVCLGHKPLDLGGNEVVCCTPSHWYSPLKDPSIFLLQDNLCQIDALL